MVRRRSVAATSPSSPRPRGTRRPSGSRSARVRAPRGRLPGLRFLPDLQAYRETSHDYHPWSTPTSRTSTSTRSSTAPGIVLVRGGGIVASRVLQRLIDDREQHGAQTQIVHVFRTYVTGAHGPDIWMRRRGGDGWAYQGFNYPKSVWGGQLKAQMRKLEGDGAGRPTTRTSAAPTPRSAGVWQQQMRGPRGRLVPDACRRGRWTCAGPTATRSLTRSRRRTATRRSPADFVIDCTGLEADIAEHRVLADLLDTRRRGPQPARPARRRAQLRGARQPQAATGRCTPRARPRSAATSPAWTRSSACRSPPRRSPTTWPGGASAGGSARCAPRAVAEVGPEQADLKGVDAMVPTLADASRPGSSCSLVVGGLWTALITPLLPVAGPWPTRYRRRSSCWSPWPCSASAGSSSTTCSCSSAGRRTGRRCSGWSRGQRGLLLWVLVAGPGPVHRPAARVGLRHPFRVVGRLWFVVNGPMRVPFVRWRFRGGRLV